MLGVILKKELKAFFTNNGNIVFMFFLPILLIFKRNKEFIYLITIQPLLIFLLMSFLLPYSKTHNVAVCDHSENTAAAQALEDMEGIRTIRVNEDDITEKLIGGSAELAVIVNADGTTQILLKSRQSSCTLHR